jgi:hypothetical protein
VELDGGRGRGSRRHRHLDRGAGVGLRVGRPVCIESLDVYERRGDGHTLSRHCGVDPSVEADRLARHRGLAASGSFTDATTAQRCVASCVAAHHSAVVRWRRGGTARLVLDHDMGAVVGAVLWRSCWARGDLTPLPATRVRAVLRRNPRYASGFAVLTAYPVRDQPATYARRP